jgi:hypothetical protein
MEVFMRDNRMIIAGILVVFIIAGIVLVSTNVQYYAGTTQIEPALEGFAGKSTPVEDQEPAVQLSTSTATGSGTDLVQPTPRAGLKATDPGSVNLASGSVQLIEAFAFW